MLEVLLLFAIIFILIFLAATYYFKVYLPVEKEQSEAEGVFPALFLNWEDFILKIIDGCDTEEQCFTCNALLIVFNQHFSSKKKDLPKSYYDRVNALHGHLDKRYKAIINYKPKPFNNVGVSRLNLN